MLSGRGRGFAGLLVARDDDALTNEDRPVVIPVLENDGDPDGDPLTILAVGQAFAGRLRIEGSDLVCSPLPGFIGRDRFGYTVATHGETAQATVRAHVLAIDPGLILPLPLR